MALLYDQFNNPIDLKALKEEQAGPTIAGVRSVISGHPSAGLTPARLARLLRDAETGDATPYLELAEDMEEKDLHYRAVISTRKLQVSQLDVSVVPASDDANDIKNAELVEDWINRETLAEELFDILDAIAKGYSVQEIMWETSENQWMPARLEWRDPRWFRFDRDDGKTLRLIGDDGTEEPLAPYKYVIHTHKAKSGLAIRGGLARAAGWGYLFKNFNIKSWVAFAEVYGQPLRLGKYHPGATETEKAALLRAVANISQDAAAIIPETMIIDFVKTEIKGSTDLFERLANYMDLQVSKAVLGQTTTTDAISGGHAVSKEHNEVREDIERSDAKQLAGCTNRAVIRPLIDLNRGPQKRYPRIQIGRPEEVDVPQVVKGVSVLVPLGLKVGQNEMRQMLGLKEPDGDEELLAPQGGSATPVDDGDVEKEEAARALAAANRQEDDAIERLVASLAESGELGDLMEPLTEPIESLLAESESFEEFTQGLAGLLKDMDETKLAEVIARSQFVARLAGETGADIGND